MNKAFADSFYFFALLNKKDEFHSRAVEWTKQFLGILVTTEWVLTELADGLAPSRTRNAFQRTRERLANDPNNEIVPLSMDLHEEGIRLYEDRQDKDWSLTDCVSFVVMSRNGITEALTEDHHFEQAGFVAVFKQ